MGIIEDARRDWWGTSIPTRIAVLKWRSRNNKRLDRQTVVEAFEEILFRGPRDDEVRQVVDNGLDRAALVDGLRACAEHRKVVGLLRALLRRDSRSWLRREPTRAELAAAIGRLRGHYKNDEDLRRATEVILPAIENFSGS